MEARRCPESDLFQLCYLRAVQSCRMFYVTQPTRPVLGVSLSVCKSTSWQALQCSMHVRARASYTRAWTRKAASIERRALQTSINNGKHSHPRCSHTCRCIEDFRVTMLNLESLNLGLSKLYEATEDRLTPDMTLQHSKDAVE